MNDIGNHILTEDSFRIINEDGSGTLLLESAPEPININNYEFVKADNGISVTEKIR